MNTRQEILQIIETLEQRSDNIQEVLNTIPEGKISTSLQHGRIVPIATKVVDGKRVRFNLPKHPDVAAALVRRSLLEQEAVIIKHNHDVLTRTMKNLKPFSDELAVEELKNMMSGVSEDFLSKVLASWSSDEWSHADYEKLEYRPDELKHKTSFGLRVRSKSELIIAEMLFKYDLPFRYEEVIHIGNSSFAPDFTVRRRDGKLIYWEHEGLTNVKEYLEWQVYKERMYAGIEITPWDNLIVTYDDSNGSLNLGIVEAAIRNRLLD